MGGTGERTFRVIIPKDVKKEIIKLPKEYRDSLKEIFRTLREDPAPIDKYDVKKLRGMKNCFRIRKGKMRIVYKILEDEKRILIIRVGMREKVYKGL